MELDFSSVRLTRVLIAWSLQTISIIYGVIKGAQQSERGHGPICSRFLMQMKIICHGKQQLSSSPLSIYPLREKPLLCLNWKSSASFQSKIQKYAAGVCQVSSVYITVIVSTVKGSRLVLNSIKNLVLLSYSPSSQRKHGNVMDFFFYWWCRIEIFRKRLIIISLDSNKNTTILHHQARKKEKRNDE